MGLVFLLFGDGDGKHVDGGFGGAIDGGAGKRAFGSAGGDAEDDFFGLDFLEVVEEVVG